MNVLSIRGGGIKGLLPARVLAGVEDLTGKPIHAQFDLIVGTSTGGILGLALAGGMTANAAVELYRADGPRIFKRCWMHRFGLTGSRYDSLSLRAVLAERLGSSAMGDAKTKVMVTATDLDTRGARFFSSWDDPLIPVVDAALATSAAPTYFDPARIDGRLYADGGLFANNPAMCAYLTAQRLRPRDRIAIVDLACGQPDTEAVRHQHWGMLDYAADAVGLCLDAGMDAASEQCRAACAGYYVEVVPRLGDASRALDDVSAENITALMAVDVSYQARQIARFLVG